jgi:HEAT repeat protein
VYRDSAQAASAKQDAAQILGAVGDERGIAALIEGAGDAAAQAATLKALQEAMSRDQSVAEKIAAALDGDDKCEPRVGIWARLVPGKAAVDKAWRRCSSASDFTLKLRLARSLRNPELLAEVEREPEPLLRVAAVEAGGPLLVSDGDPGVRRASLLKADAPSAVTALQKDAWPMVRRAAAETLGRHCGAATGALTAAVEKDAAEEVRREALVALSRCGPVPVPLLAKILQTPEQPVAVRELAAALVAKQGGGPQAAKLLADTVIDVLNDPGADEQAASLAVACLRALGRLKDASRPVLEALGAAANEPLSPSVRAASMEAIGSICPEGAGAALKKGGQDPDGMVRRAAQQALDKCKR